MVSVLDPWILSGIFQRMVNYTRGEDLKYNIYSGRNADLNNLRGNHLNALE